MELRKFCVKFFAEDPAAVKLDAFIPVYHRWIQQQSVEGQLVDVADYGHLPQGPGVLLVAHEADYCMDAMEGPLGLLYNRKISAGGRLSDRLASGLRAALVACVKLENEPEFQGKLRFKAGRALFIANDRLNAPNTEEAFRSLRSDLGAALAKVYPSIAEPRRISSDPRSRLTVEVSSLEPVRDVASLLSRLS
jgi:hypothetical protein